MSVTGPDVARFDGVQLPLPGVRLGFGGGLAKPPADALRLGVGPGLGTGRLGGTTMTDVADDVDAFTLSLGGLGDTGVAESTASLTFSNERGDYDPDNLAGRFTDPNLLNAQDAGFPGAGIGNWRVGGGATLARAPTGYRSDGALQITCDGTTPPWLVDDANAAAAAIPVSPGQQTSQACHLYSTTPRPWRLVHRYLLNGVYVTQANGAFVWTYANRWTEIPAPAALVPGGVNQLIVQLESSANPPAGEVHLADNFRAGLGAVLTAGASLVDLDVPVAVTLTWGGTAYPWFTGILGGAQPDDAPPRPTVTISCLDAVAMLGRVRLPETIPQWDGDTTGGRINRLLDAAGHPTSLRQIATGRTILGPTTLGDTVRQLVEQAVRTEYGLLWADGAGVIYFYDRYQAATAPRSTAVQLTISDDGIMSGLQRAKDRERLANDWQITRNALPVGLPAASDDANTPQNEEEQPVTQQAVDQASIDRYGQSTYTEEAGTLLRSDDEARALAQWGVARTSTPRMLISQLQANPLQRPGVDWPALLGLRLLDLVRAVRAYSPAASPVDVQLLAKGIDLAVVKDPPAVELSIATDTPPLPEAPNALRLGGTVGLGEASLSY